MNITNFSEWNVAILNNAAGDTIKRAGQLAGVLVNTDRKILIVFPWQNLMNVTDSAAEAALHIEVLRATMDKCYKDRDKYTKPFDSIMELEKVIVRNAAKNFCGTITELYNTDLSPKQSKNYTDGLPEVCLWERLKESGEAVGKRPAALKKFGDIFDSHSYSTHPGLHPKQDPKAKNLSYRMMTELRGPR